MQCQDMEKFIHVYLDREFAEEDRADYERHLAVCEHCRRLARFEQRFKAQLKMSLARPHLRLDEREQVRARIMQTLAEAPPADHGTRRWILRLVPAAAAAGVLMALVLGRSDRKPPVVGQSLMANSNNQPMELITRDPHALRDWYREKLGIAIAPPRFSDGRTALVGGRIGRVEAKEAAHLIYSQGDRKISVMVFRPENVPFRGMVSRLIGNKSVYFSYGGGQNVAAFRHRGVGYTITGALPRHELDALVRDVLHQPSNSGEPPLVNAVPVKAPGAR
jgi:anti-sigma factor RsiW